MITAEQLRATLHYDPDTGVFTRRAGGKGVRPRQIGQPVGTVVHSNNGYMTISVGGRSHYAHRLAWLYVHGKFPPGHIDHRDGVPTNNRISNLRIATRSQQSANTRRRRDSTSGVKGVYWHPVAQKWQARIYVNDKYRSLGYFADKADAAAAYAAAADKHFGEYARHD